MKIKAVLLFISIVTTACLYSQNAIGVSYSTRIFPFQHYKNTNNDYVRGPEVEVSDAIENVVQLNYQFHRREGGNRVIQLGLNYYFADLHFQQQFTTKSETWYSPDPSAYPKVSREYTHSGNYAYGFLGIHASLLKSRDLGSHFFLKTGVSMSLNFW